MQPNPFRDPLVGSQVVPISELFYIHPLNYNAYASCGHHEPIRTVQAMFRCLNIPNYNLAKSKCILRSDFLNTHMWRSWSPCNKKRIQIRSNYLRKLREMSDWLQYGRGNRIFAEQFCHLVASIGEIECGTLSDLFQTLSKNCVWQRFERQALFDFRGIFAWTPNPLLGPLDFGLWRINSIKKKKTSKIK